MALASIPARLKTLEVRENGEPSSERPRTVSTSTANTSHSARAWRTCLAAARAAQSARSRGSSGGGDVEGEVGGHEVASTAGAP